VILVRKHYTLLFIFLTGLLAYSSAYSVEGDNKTGAARLTKKSEKTEWVMGLGLGVFEYHFYPGAKKTKQLIFPVPYFTYRSPSFEIHRGFKSFLYHGETVVLDVSADFGLPVDSDDTLARQGMPDLDFVLQLGPSLEFLLNDRKNSYFDMRFELPLRIAIASDFSYVENIGYLIEPKFSFNHRRQNGKGIAQKASIGLKFATQDYHAYYYNVSDEFANATRTTFKSNSGFGGSFAKYRISYKTDDYIYWAFMRYQSLRGAVFEDSSLVLKKDYFFVGLGFSWLFASSK
jgi:outer membrane scaffolding protein for murein synthesis (MipA/OmpV family)